MQFNGSVTLQIVDNLYLVCSYKLDVTTKKIKRI